MDQVMTIEEIEKQFAREWVLLADPLTNDQLEVLGGKVLYHSRDRDEFDRKSLEFPAPRTAVIFAGLAPEGMEFVL